MSYKTILVHVDQSRHTPARIRIAAQLAAAENAHLIGAAMTGVSRYLYRQNHGEITATIVADQVDFLYQRAEDALAQFERIARESEVRSYERRLLNDDYHGGLCLQARYCDIVVLGQTDPYEAQGRIISDLPEYVVLNSGHPVLIIPHAGEFKCVGERVLVAWDGSMEATRAINAAIPVLRRAGNVVLAIFDSPAGPVDPELHGEEPGADIALFLARHDVKVEVKQQVTSSDVGNALLSLAADTDSDLIVMGGYGHTSFREVLLGGVTKTVLETMTVPVLMSH
ncbi:MAG TPA: universal stress protein [Noviherbaspirillum sp.]|jgi:nucleotide-binding universal stress UspA family protein|uniref:universal stress protein n=1 Tax=Noviherbaspirillum sp. TaxID=1926288 RepID=UPI002DDCF9C4|nr:universal stress protein [Noviherbaspirillum sp.]HEV2609526.1 universal stress protein [Noviherbaspirillum sp.]